MINLGGHPLEYWLERIAIAENAENTNRPEEVIGEVALFKYDKVEIDDYLEFYDSMHRFVSWGAVRGYGSPSSEIPHQIFTAMQKSDASLIEIPEDLSRENYGEKFRTLLWLEEAHQVVEMHRLALKAVKISADDDHLFRVQVPGLAEGKPNLMPGDPFFLKHPPDGSCYYMGRVKEVRRTDVDVNLRDKLDFSDYGLNQQYDVSFLAPRTSYLRCHAGVELVKLNLLLKLRLFPEVEPTLEEPLIDISEEHSDASLNFSRSLNTCQKQAVVNALRAVCRPGPYIIFGPPGTGKTFTLVEAILQAYQRNTGAKILVCGSSNACTDALAQLIKKSGLVPDEEILRVAAFRRQEHQIPKDIKDITATKPEDVQMRISKARVVITTCVQSGSLYKSYDLSDMILYDFLFIDEAGHTTEPETSVTLPLLKGNGCFVLAGDPRQLGPVCMSQLASVKGLGTSLLERLFGRDVYSLRDDKTYDPRYIMQLVECYRCDPRVLSISNEVFYNNALKFVNSTPQKWLDLLNVTHPLVFHPVRGNDVREHPDPSRYNPKEATAVIDYVKRLYRAGLKPEQLGIITPYKRQIRYIHGSFVKENLELCKISTMESFQGDEREIMIISIVRSYYRGLGDEAKKYQLDFLLNPRRFNVAISRARWMVIAIGHPDVLALDKYWSMYVQKASRVV